MATAAFGRLTLSNGAWGIFKTVGKVQGCSTMANPKIQRTAISCSPESAAGTDPYTRVLDGAWSSSSVKEAVVTNLDVPVSTIVPFWGVFL